MDIDLAALSSTLTELRDDAIKARAESGIEAEWLDDEEYFQGIDDSNRAERKIKPTSPDGRVTIERKAKKSTRSSAFVNITRRYVNAAAAHVADKLIPNDDSNFGMKPTPIPDLIKRSKDMSPALDEAGIPMMKPVMDDAGSPQMQPQMQNGQPVMGPDGHPAMAPATAQVTNADLAKQEMKEAKESCEKAFTQIKDWLVEGGYHGHARRVINDSARIGTGVLKGPFPEMSRRRAVVKALEGIGVVIKEEIAPRSRRIDVWNLFPDPSCGEDIHRGKYIFEQDAINSRLLGELKKDPSYISEAIDRVLEEGPKNPVTRQSRRGRNYSKTDKETFDIWYFHGYLSKKDLETCGYEFETEQEEPGLLNAEQDESGDMTEADMLEVERSFGEADYGEADEAMAPERNDDNEQFPAIAVMVNETIIKATMSPLDSGKFPYDLMLWQRRAGHWAGEGVARQMRTSQDGVNAATRNLMDNAGLSGGPILIMDRKKIVPADGEWKLGPHKLFYTTDDFDGGNIKDAITWITIPSMQAELMNIIQFWMKAAEEETGLPMLLQGQQGGATQTKGGMQLLNNNGTSLLRRVTNTYDDDVTKPHIGSYYEWLLMYGEDDSMKGDFTIEARASSVLIERDAHSQLLPNLLGASLNPAYGVDPEEVMNEMLKSQRFDAEKLRLSPEKKAEAAKMQPPPDPRIQVAQINADTRLKLEELDDKDAADHAMAAAQLQLNEQNFDAQQAELDRQLAQWSKNIDSQVDMVALQGDRELGLAELKATLARESAKLKTAIQLSRENARASAMPKPAIEPAGRAAPGNSYQA